MLRRRSYTGQKLFHDAVERVAVLEGPGGTTNLTILRYSRGKRSVELNLKSDAGWRILEQLVGQADVLVKNFRPGVLARLGFPWPRLHELNDQLIYTTISGFGHDDVMPSPYGDRPAYAIIAGAMAGLTHLAGEADRDPARLRIGNSAPEQMPASPRGTAGNGMRPPGTQAGERRKGRYWRKTRHGKPWSRAGRGSRLRPAL